MIINDGKFSKNIEKNCYQKIAPKRQASRDARGAACRVSGWGSFREIGYF